LNRPHPPHSQAHHSFVVRRLTSGLRSQEQICRQAPLSFGRYCPCDEREARYILAALRSLRQTPPVVPPVADGPGVSLASTCGDAEPEIMPHADMLGRARNRQNQPHEDETITNSSLAQEPSGTARRDPYNEDNTTRGGARF